MIRSISGNPIKSPPSSALTEVRDLSTLIWQAGDGDITAIGALYDRYAPAILDIGVRLLGSTSDAEDLVHDVFVGLARAVRSYEGRGTFDGWIKRVATREALMKLRRLKLISEVPLMEAVTPTPGNSDATTTLINQLTLWDAIGQIPTIQRTVFVLKEIQGYTHAEIAEMEGITVSGSKIRLYRARESLRALLEESK